MMPDRRTIVFSVIAFVCAIPTVFFAVYGVLLVHEALTFRGEGSLGHVGMYIAAGLFPLLALLFGGFTLLAWRRARLGGEE
jgi:hypothetical protein